jgi:hypothetical protein
MIDRRLPSLAHKKMSAQATQAKPLSSLMQLNLTIASPGWKKVNIFLIEISSNTKCADSWSAPYSIPFLRLHLK